MEPSVTFGIIKQESEKISVELSDESIVKFDTYLREIIRWNQRINLTGLKLEKDIIANLLVDSLAFSRAFCDELVESVLDIGSGAGFPGLPLKILDSRLSLTMLEPNLKKVSFLHHIVGTLGLNNVRVEPKRIEEMSNISQFKKPFDCIVLKALRFDVCLPYVGALLSNRGLVVLSRSKKSENASDISGFSIQKEIDYQLPFGFGERVLVVLRPTSI